MYMFKSLILPLSVQTGGNGLDLLLLVLAPFAGLLFERSMISDCIPSQNHYLQDSWVAFLLFLKALF